MGLVGIQLLMELISVVVYCLRIHQERKTGSGQMVSKLWQWWYWCLLLWKFSQTSVGQLLVPLCNYVEGCIFQVEGCNHDSAADYFVNLPHLSASFTTISQVRVEYYTTCQKKNGVLYCYSYFRIRFIMFMTLLPVPARRWLQSRVHVFFFYYYYL